MAVYRSQGPIDFDDIQEFFGETVGSSFSIDDYYRGGGIVPATGNTAGRNSIFEIQAGNYLGTIIYLTGNSGNYTGQTHTYTDAGPTTYTVPNNQVPIQIPGSDLVSFSSDTAFKGVTYEHDLLFERGRDSLGSGFGFGAGLFGEGAFFLVGGSGDPTFISVLSTTGFTVPAGNAFFGYTTASSTFPVEIGAQNLTITAFEEDVATVSLSSLLPRTPAVAVANTIVAIPAGLTTDEDLSQALLTSLSNLRLITENFTITREQIIVPEVDPDNAVWVVRLTGGHRRPTIRFDAPAGDFSGSMVLPVLGDDIRSDASRIDNREEFYIHLTGDSGGPSVQIPPVTNTGPVVLNQNATTGTTIATIDNITNATIDDIELDITYDSFDGDYTDSHIIANLTYTTSDFPSSENEFTSDFSSEIVLNADLSSVLSPLSNYWPASLTNPQQYVTFESDDYTAVYQIVGANFSLSASTVTISVRPAFDNDGGIPIGTIPTADTNATLRFDYGDERRISVLFNDGTNTVSEGFFVQSRTPTQTYFDPTAFGQHNLPLNSPITVELRNISSADNPNGNNSITVSNIEIRTTPHAAAEVNLTIPTQSINETFELSPNLTTDTALRDDLLALAQANTNITNNWTVTSQDRAITRRTFRDTGYTADTLTRDEVTRDITEVRLTTPDDLSNNPDFAVGSTLRVSRNILEITSVTATMVSAGMTYNIAVNTISQASVSDDLTIFVESGTEDVSVPVVEFISLDQIDHAIMFSVNTLLGDLSDSALHLEADGSGPISSEITIRHSGFTTNNIQIALGGQDRQGIIQAVTEGFEMYPEIYATTVGDRILVEDRRFRNGSINISVTVAGSSGLIGNDFTITETQVGEPGQRTEFATGDYNNSGTTSSTEWGFISSAGTTGSSNPSSWPTANEVFIDIGTDVITPAELQTVLRLPREPDDTVQVVTSSTVQINESNTINIATYNITGAQRQPLVFGGNLVLTLDGTTITNERGVPPTNGAETTLFITNTPRGDVNTNIPDHPGAGNPLPPISLDNFYNANDGSNN